MSKLYRHAKRSVVVLHSRAAKESDFLLKKQLDEKMDQLVFVR